STIRLPESRTVGAPASRQGVAGGIHPPSPYQVVGGPTSCPWAKDSPVPDRERIERAHGARTGDSERGSSRGRRCVGPAGTTSVSTGAALIGPRRRDLRHGPCGGP